MFSTNQQVVYQKLEKITEIATNEDFGAWHVYPNQKKVIVEDHLYNSAGDLIKVSDITIDGGNYDLLMSENPSFAPNKPADEFRQSDIKYIIDQIRNASSQ